MCRQQEDPLFEAADAVGADEAWVGPGVHAHEARNVVLDKVWSFMRDSGTYREGLQLNKSKSQHRFLFSLSDFIHILTLKWECVLGLELVCTL